MSKILLVEDDINIVENLTVLLEGEGYKVERAMGQVEALALIGKESFDLALLDISIPDGSGYAVCSAIKGEKATADVPV
ncbi:MAG: response regulator, partial [Anaerovoracaceae bacterium]